MLCASSFIALCPFFKNRIRKVALRNLKNYNAEAHQTIYSVEHTALCQFKVQQVIFTIYGITLLGGIFWLCKPQDNMQISGFEIFCRLSVSSFLSFLVYISMNWFIIENFYRQKEARIGMLKHIYKKENKDFNLRRTQLYWMDDAEYKLYEEEEMKPGLDSYTCFQIGLLFLTALAINIKFAFEW